MKRKSYTSAHQLLTQVYANSSKFCECSIKVVLRWSTYLASPFNICGIEWTKASDARPNFQSRVLITGSSAVFMQQLGQMNSSIWTKVSDAQSRALITGSFFMQKVVALCRWCLFHSFRADSNFERHIFQCACGGALFRPRHLDLDVTVVEWKKGVGNN